MDGKSRDGVTTYWFNRYAVAFYKYRSCDDSGMGEGQQHVWLFDIYRHTEPFGHIDPEAFAVTVVDGFRSGERVRIRVKKWNKPDSPVYTSSATSPDAATVGLSVSDGDTIAVAIDYPDGFLYGNEGSGYIIQWVLHNTGWVLE